MQGLTEVVTELNAEDTGRGYTDILQPNEEWFSGRGSPIQLHTTGRIWLAPWKRRRSRSEIFCGFQVLFAEMDT